MQCGLSTQLSKAVVHGLSYATFCPNMHFRVRRFFATGMHMQGMPEIPDLWRTLTLQCTQSKNTLTNASFFMIWLPVDFITVSLSCHLLAAKTIHRLMRSHPYKTLDKVHIQGSDRPNVRFGRTVQANFYSSVRPKWQNLFLQNTELFSLLNIGFFKMAALDILSLVYVSTPK